MGSDAGDRLRDLSDRVARLSPHRRDPERFFEERDEIVHELDQAASDADASARLP